MTQPSLEFVETQPIRKPGSKPLTKAFQLQYSHPHGQLYQGDSIDWLKSLDSESIDLVFADPPYNIKKADWDNFENQEQYIDWSLQW
ncbi:DNA methyltransferase, partial [Planktothrix sp.]